MPNPSQEPPASSKAPNEDLNDMDVLCTFKIKIESQNIENGCIKHQWKFLNQDKDPKPQSATSSILQSPNEDLEDMDVYCTFKIKVESQNSDNGYIKNQWPYPNQHWCTKKQWPYSSQDQDAKLAHHCWIVLWRDWTFMQESGSIQFHRGWEGMVVSALKSRFKWHVWDGLISVQ